MLVGDERVHLEEFDWVWDDLALDVLQSFGHGYNKWVSLDYIIAAEYKTVVIHRYFQNLLKVSWRIELFHL